MNVNRIFCARCNGILLAGYPNPKQLELVVDGKHYHFYCGSRVLEEKEAADMKKLEEHIKARDEKYKL